MQRLLSIATFAYIVLRGYLYFSDQQVLAAILDLILFPIYSFACIKDRRAIYIGLIAYLPASSVFYLPTGAIPFDLSLIIALLSVSLLSREVPKRELSNEIHFALFIYGLLCIYLFTNIFYDSLFDMRELRDQIKVLYFLATSATAGFLFAKIYDPRDSDYILKAIEIGLIAYVVAGCIGYLFPLASYTWQVESEFLFKSLFRYPGMSSSNYISHVLLVLLAMHHFISRRQGELGHPLLYVGAISVVAIASQSRGFVVTAVILLISWWVLDVVRQRVARPIRESHPGRIRTNIVVGLLTVAAIIVFSDFFVELGQQTVDRFSLRAASTVNISRRLDEWQATFAHFDQTDRSMIRGNLSYPEELRPHNVILSAVLVFGIPIALCMAFLMASLVLRFPILIFMFLGAQAEILFVTGIYDFLFFVFLTLLCSRQNWTNDNLVALEISGRRIVDANSA